MRALITALLFLAVLQGCSQSGPSMSMPDGTAVQLEIALTPQEHAHGLSDRESLCEQCGMLFVFDDTSQRGFWMYRMHFALDVIFLDENYTVIDVAYDMQPCKAECIVYRSREGAKYVLEVNAGFADAHGVEKGGRLLLNS